ncbi:hypothetical protein O0235_00840 [Tepidiforma flava]|uniref:Uncharacterized protein n=1 Tax=Tepidiforma flava TaxID=3004094 RepID=A0ABY7M6P5_9CHLR|nr:hypothetical protein [Tepidiforma flava]WBL36196.1 hypothetical protein O0235_00840 [Tepidiforma flava]
MTAEMAFTARSSLAATVRNYIILTKPRVISLLLVTTVPAMVVAAGGWPGTWLVLATLIGGRPRRPARTSSTAGTTATSTPSCGGPGSGRR